MEPGFPRACEVHLRLGLMLKVHADFEAALKHLTLALIDATTPASFSKLESESHFSPLASPTPDHSHRNDSRTAVHRARTGRSTSKSYSAATCRAPTSFRASSATIALAPPNSSHEIPPSREFRPSRSSGLALNSLECSKRRIPWRSWRHWRNFHFELSLSTDASLKRTGLASAEKLRDTSLPSIELYEAQPNFLRPWVKNNI